MRTGGKKVIGLVMGPVLKAMLQRVPQSLVPFYVSFPTVFVLSFLLTVQPAASIPEDLSTARKNYKDARQAIERGRWTEYEQLKATLNDYPLAIYLDYYQLSRQVHKMQPAQAQQFVDSSANTPLKNRFLSVYLHQAGKARRWADFLQVMPTEPYSVVLKCYYYRAQLAQGNPTTAWEGAQRLWVHGKSQPKQCDPLFKAWTQAGQLKDDVVWTRMLNVFEARQGSLLKYVARQGSRELKPWSDRLLAVYRRPETLAKQVPNQSSPAVSGHASDIAAYGVAYLARYNPAKALAQWAQFQQDLTFTPAQTQHAEHAIALRGLFARTESLVPWLNDSLARLGDDKLVEIRLRWALAERDWTALEQTLPLLSVKVQENSNWRYWLAAVHDQFGRTEQSQQLLAQLATERGYYSFLSADKLGLPYAFNHQRALVESKEVEPEVAVFMDPVIDPAAEPLPDLAAELAVEPVPEHALSVMARIAELHFHDEPNLAHSEWFNLLLAIPDPLQKQQLAQLAADQGWHRMAIDAANRAKAWNALDLRFPMAYQNTFEHYAAASKVPGTELMAIARRESAFFPEARSPVGARGLMQIMPATGKQVASSIGRPHKNADLYEIEHNVLLGSTYYRQLLDRFGGNRVFAFTAYNAGPHRVDRWRTAGKQSLPVEIWIETIPFKETRKYVQAVLSYNVVFGYMMGDTHNLLSPLEKQAAY